MWRNALLYGLAFLLTAGSPFFSLADTYPSRRMAGNRGVSSAVPGNQPDQAPKKAVLPSEETEELTQAASAGTIVPDIDAKDQVRDFFGPSGTIFTQAEARFLIFHVFLL
jgi:hypothetical protein